MGAGGHAVSVSETVLACGHRIAGFVDQHGGPGALLDRPVLASIPFDWLKTGMSVFVAVGDNFSRDMLTRDILVHLPGLPLVTLIHPSASVANSATIGAGSAILQNAVVGANAYVGNGCIVNSGAVLEHEAQLGDFASLAPSVVTGGRVSIGRRTAVGMGSVVRQSTVIGSDSVIGAASYVNRDIASRVVAIGTPATVRREREPSDDYL